MAFPAFPPLPEYSHLSPRCPVTRASRNLHDLLSSSKPLHCPGRSRHGGEPPRPLGLLSWDSSVRPSIDPLPGPGHARVATRGPRDAAPGTGAALVVLHHLGGLPSPEVAGVLQPAADPGVRRVSVDRRSLHRTDPGSADAMTSPRRWFVPLEESPRRQPHRVTAAVAPLAVPPVSSHRPCRLRSRAENPDAPADPMGSDRPIARPTSTHPPGGLHGDRSHREHPQAIDRAPAPTLGFAPPCGVATEKARAGEQAASGPCSTDEFVRDGPEWLPVRSARFFLGFVPLQGPRGARSTFGRPACAGPEDGDPSWSSPGFRSRGGPALPESVRSRSSR